MCIKGTESSKLDSEVMPNLGNSLQTVACRGFMFFLSALWNAGSDTLHLLSAFRLCGF